MFQLPISVRTRFQPQITIDEDGQETRTIVETPATYAWELWYGVPGLLGRFIRWIPADDEREDPVMKDMFYGREDVRPVPLMLKKVGAKGETQWGPSPI